MTYFTDLFMSFYDHLTANSSLPAPQLHQKLVEFLQKQDLQVEANAGTFTHGLYKELKYILCGLADDIMLAGDDKKWWSQYLLEEKFFGTHIAGEKIFDNIDQLLNSSETYKKSLFPAYLYLLSLGFKGKYNFMTDEIADYKNKLFTSAYDQKPVLEYLSKDALDQNTSRPFEIQDQAVKSWGMFLAYSAGSYVVAMHTTWLYYTRGLKVWY